MRLHGNAALSWSGRRRLARRVVDDGWTLSAAAAAAGVSVRCARKWVVRYGGEGEAGIADRSSAPRRVANRTSSERVAAICALRRLRMTAAEIAELLGMSLSTVSGILTRCGLGRLGRLGQDPPVRYERSRPGELVHVDVKKLGRIEGGAGWRVRGGVQHYNRTRTDRDGKARRTVGWEYVHIAIDDYSRLAYAEVLADERAATAIAFLRRAAAFFRRHGIQIERVLTDNGSAYVSTIHAIACRALASASCAPSHVDRRPTAKPNASSAPSSPAGPTAPSTPQAANAPKPLTAGSTTTTINADTQPSAASRPSPEPTCSGRTARARGWCSTRRARRGRERAREARPPA
jgi:transposase